MLLSLGLSSPAIGDGCPAATATANPATPTLATLIPYEKFTLANGLTVIVHTDRKAPIVAVNVWYHVGSKNEDAGKTGFAHLFEHLMFQGSEHYNDEYFKPFEQVGATSMNGTTSFDRTNYFQNVPTTALDLALWMESDRMGHLLGVVDAAAARRAARRGAERKAPGRKSAVRPRAPRRCTGRASRRAIRTTRCRSARWTTSMPPRSTTCASGFGPITVRPTPCWCWPATSTSRRRAQRPSSYFGTHRARARRRRAPASGSRPATTAGAKTMYDQVAQPRWQRYWNTPPDNTARLRIPGRSSAKSWAAARRRDCTSAWSTVNGWRTGRRGPVAARDRGDVQLSADVKQDVDRGAGRGGHEEELQRFIAQGPTKAELDRAKIAIRAGFVRGLERIGGFGGKADVLASCEVFTGSPDCYGQSLAWIDAAQPADLQRVARRWLSQGDYTLEVRATTALRRSRDGRRRPQGSARRSPRRFPTRSSPDCSARSSATACP